MSARGNENYATCPYPDCGKRSGDMWEIVGELHDGADFICDHCGRDIEVADMEFSVTYTCLVPGKAGK